MAAFALEQRGPGGSDGMALASGPCLLPAGDNFPGDKGGLFSPCLAQPRFALSQDQPRHSSGSDPGPGEELLPEPCPSLKAAHQIYPLGILLTASACGEDTRETRPQSCTSLCQENRDGFSIPEKEALRFL